MLATLRVEKVLICRHELGILNLNENVQRKDNALITINRPVVEYFKMNRLRI